MTPKYSHKTTISLYRFDSEENYWSWLNANKKNPSEEYHDVMALVKNESLNGGYDLFINGHSLTKSRIWIKTLNGEIKDASEEGVFSPSTIDVEDCQGCYGQQRRHKYFACEYASRGGH